MTRSLSRRTFLRLTSAATLAAPAILHGQTNASAIQRKDLRMQITRVGSQPSSKGPADWFTGTVRIDPLFAAPAQARATGASVTFEPGARTVWHTHPLGQTLIVTAGAGRVRAKADRSKKFGLVTSSNLRLTRLLQLAGFSFKKIKYWSGFAGGSGPKTLNCSANAERKKI